MSTTNLPTNTRDVSLFFMYVNRDGKEIFNRYPWSYPFPPPLRPSQTTCSTDPKSKPRFFRDARAVSKIQLVFCPFVAIVLII